MGEILELFHHVHHENEGHKVHHCGGDHEDAQYSIEHCKCGKHKIDKKEAIGHDFEKKEVKVEFSEECLEGGWHVESGVIGARNDSRKG
ncbi:MAG: hypothetical protein ABIE22_01005 [archaeon]